MPRPLRNSTLNALQKCVTPAGSTFPLLKLAIARLLGYLFDADLCGMSVNVYKLLSGPCGHGVVRHDEFDLSDDEIANKWRSMEQDVAKTNGLEKSSNVTVTFSVRRSGKLRCFRPCTNCEFRLSKLFRAIL